MSGATALTLVCRQSTVFSLQPGLPRAERMCGFRLRFGGLKKILIAPHLCPTSHRCPKCPICPAKNKKTSHRLDHSNGAAGAFLGLIGLLGLIGQRLTEWQALFQNVFCGAAPALRFSEKKLQIAPHPCPTSHRCPKCHICPQKNKTPPRFPLRVSDRSDRSDRSDTQALSKRQRGAKHPFLGRLNCADACLPPGAEVLRM